MSRHSLEPASVRSFAAPVWAKRHVLVLIVSALLMTACGQAADREPTTTSMPTETTSTTAAPGSTEPSSPSTSVDTTTTTTTPTSTTVTLPPPPDEPGMSALAWGLFCLDLAGTGRDYVEAVAYWNAEGRPARMDADQNGIPCETVYDAAEVTTYWGDPLPTGLVPGPGSGWRPSSREAPVTPACCADNHRGPESPPLPPPTGAWPDDGAFAVEVHRQEGRPDVLEFEIRRWLPCTEQPESCAPDPAGGDVYADPADTVTRTVALDESLIVVIRPIGRLIDDVWVDDPIEGNGAALSSLLARMDAALTSYAAPAVKAGGDIERDFLEIGAADATFPYGPAVGNEWLVSYRGPEGTDLTPGFYVLFEQDEFSSIYGWWCTLEIVDGVPVLYAWAGQIAG